MKVLEIENLTKTYEKFKLDGVSFELEEGKIMGFVGRNGAGKTTTLKSMLNFVHPDCGKVRIAGYDINTDEFAVKNNIGFVSGSDCFYGMKKIKKITDVTKKFFPDWDDDCYSEIMKTFEIDENKLVKNLSAGMKIKYQIALAMSHGAKLLILDEPSSGLDPVSRVDLVQLFKKYVSDGKHSIIFSTHVTSDLDKCADCITYIKRGHIIDSCNIDDFKKIYAGKMGKEEDKINLDDIMIFIEKNCQVKNNFSEELK